MFSKIDELTKLGTSKDKEHGTETENDPEEEVDLNLKRRRGGFKGENTMRHGGKMGGR